MNFKWKNIEKQYLVLAPMANITTYPFRSLVKDAGADVVFTPMISSNAVLYNSKEALDIAWFKEREQPVIVQLFGYDGNILNKAVKIVEKTLKPAGIDINMGCPAPKITGNESGSALLKDYGKATKITEMIRDGFSGQLSVKLRLGWEKTDIENFIDGLERLGVDAVTIHGRTAKAGFNGEADWGEINRLAKRSKMAIIGNGDINTWQKAIDRLKNLDLQGIMIGRAALGNPWIFTETKKRKPIERSRSLIAEMIREQTSRFLEYKKDKPTILEMRKHLCWYLKGFEGAQHLRTLAVKVVTSKDIDDILEILEKP